jgi:hypothetical protein
MVLAIEADGASYWQSGSVRDRDRLRGEHLQRLGWRYHRLWSTNWFRHPDDEVAKLQEAYQRAVAAAEPDDAVPPGPASAYQDREPAPRGQRSGGSDGQPSGRAGRTDPLTGTRTTGTWAAARTAESVPARQAAEQPPVGQTMATGTGRADQDHHAGLALALGTLQTDPALGTAPAQARRPLQASPELPERALETEPAQARPAIEARPAQASPVLDAGGTQPSAALEAGRSPFGPVAPPQLPPPDPSES